MCEITHKKMKTRSEEKHTHAVNVSLMMVLQRQENSSKK